MALWHAFRFSVFALTKYDFVKFYCFMCAPAWLRHSLFGGGVGAVFFFSFASLPFSDIDGAADILFAICVHVCMSGPNIYENL